MPKYQVRDGFKLIVTNPAKAGESLDKLGGDIVELTEEEAALYPNALDLVGSGAPVGPVDVAAPQAAADAPAQADLHQPTE